MFKAELNRFLTNELAEDGYSGVQVRHTPARTEIIILATRTQNVLGGCGARLLILLMFGGCGSLSCTVVGLTSVCICSEV